MKLVAAGKTSSGKRFVKALKKIAHDPVNHPAHYDPNGIEVIDALESWGLDKDFCLANAVKYIARAGKKDPSKLVEDLRKAAWYLNRRIEKLVPK
jgi:Zn-dependent M28 family amino/carboxypeptidase